MSKAGEREGGRAWMRRYRPAWRIRRCGNDPSSCRQEMNLVSVCYKGRARGQNWKPPRAGSFLETRKSEKRLGWWHMGADGGRALEVARPALVAPPVPLPRDVAPRAGHAMRSSLAPLSSSDPAPPKGSDVDMLSTSRPYVGHGSPHQCNHYEGREVPHCSLKKCPGIRGMGWVMSRGGANDHLELGT